MALVPRNVKRNAHLIPDSLSHSGGVITAVIGSSSYPVTISGLTANTLYFLYLRSNAGTSQLFSSTSTPSSYRSSFSEAILVGAFYSNGATTPIFGSFVTIEGAPKSEKFSVGLVRLKTSAGNFNKANVSVDNVEGYRDGDHVRLRCRFNMGAGTSDSGTYVLQTNTNLDIDFAKIGTASAAIANTMGAGYVANASNGKNCVFAPSTTDNGFYMMYDQPSGTNNSSSFATQSNGASYTLSGEISYPVVGWTATPLKDL